MKTKRIASLCDGVFAIVMTLLIVELHIPVLGNEDDAALLTAKLISMWPKFLSFAVTFTVLGVLWAFHHRQLDLVVLYDGFFIWLNIFFFMVVSLLPFSTALLGRYHDIAIAILFYGGNLFSTWAFLFAQLAYATSHPELVGHQVDPSIVHRLKATCLWTIIAIVAAVSLAFINPTISLLIFAVLSIVQVAFQASRRVDTSSTKVD